MSVYCGENSYDDHQIVKCEVRDLIGSRIEKNTQ